MSLTSDEELFSLLESERIEENTEKIIIRSLMIKKSVVEQDEREGGLRRVLNFGHTLANAIEAENEMKSLYHGESVALGMLPMCSDSVRVRLAKVLEKLNLPNKISVCDVEKIVLACRKDKKLQGNDITVVYVPEVGKFELQKMPFSEYEKLIRQVI